MKRTFYSLIALLSLGFSQIKAQAQTTIVTLNQCIEAALSSNPNIKEAGNATSITALGVKTAQSGFYPSVSAEASGGFSNEYRLGNDYKTGSAKLFMDQVIWQNGKVTSSVEQARFSNKATENQLESRKQDITLSVKIFFYNCLQQEQLYQISLDDVSKARLFLDYASERYKAGVGRKSDVLKAESDLKEAEFESNSFLNALKQSQNELVMLTGLQASRFSNLQSTYVQDNQRMLTKQADSLYIMAQAQYPELQAVNNLGLSQQATIKEARADLYPRLSVNAGYDWSYNPTLQEQKGWYSALTLRWNLFNGYAGRNRLKTEQIRKNIYENQADELKIALFKDVSNRLIALKEADNQIALSLSLMATTSENLEIAQAQYKAGTGSMLELADARINDLSAKQKNIQAIAAYQIALANLERLIGNANN